MIDYANISIYKYSEFIWTITDCFNYDTLIWNEFNEIQKPSKEELESKLEEVLIIISKNNCKTKSQLLLNESDFTDLYSVRNKLENINEWDTYRDIVRQLRINPIENPVFPDKPQTIWKEL
jgi:hypothetical protein